jgi:dihydrolipoamide dehydrogenase
MEMASAWHGLGAKVTLLARADGLLPRMEPFAGEVVAAAFTDAGIDVRISVTVAGVRRPGGTGPVTVTLDDGGELEADEVLFATGRAPNTDDIGLHTSAWNPGPGWRWTTAAWYARWKTIGCMPSVTSTATRC